MKVSLLALAQGIVGIEMRVVSLMSLERHQLLVVENQVGALVEGRQYAHRIIELGGQPDGLGIALGSRSKADQAQNLGGQGVAHPRDDPPAPQLRNRAGPGWTPTMRASGLPCSAAVELRSPRIEPDQVLVPVPQLEEKVGLGLEPIVGLL